MIGEIPKPRFEFRTFGRNFNDIASLMSKLSAPVPEHVRIRTSKEIYIVSQKNDINNTKIRDGRMDIKSLILEKNGLEQWQPLIKAGFPIKVDMLRKMVFPSFMVEMEVFNKEECTFDEFIEIINDKPDLQAVSVEKKTFWIYDQWHYL